MKTLLLENGLSCFPSTLLHAVIFVKGNEDCTVDLYLDTDPVTILYITLLITCKGVNLS
jgi:hypothetical protein